VTLRVFENRLLRQIFGPKRDEVTGRWRKLRNKEPSIIRIIKSRRMKWAWQLAGLAKNRNEHTLLVRKPEGRRSLGRPRRRWVDNIKMDLGKIGWGGGTGLVWLRTGTSGELL
jgi:hypothetical protein